MADFYTIDTTLRDGEQTAGVAFSKEQKLKIATMLDEAGVQIIEAGIPAMGEEEMQCLYKINNLGLKATVLSWNRLCKDDIDKSLVCGVKNIHISAPASDTHIYRKLNKTREIILEDLKRIISYAVDKDCNVSVGAEDASRADQDYLISFYKVCQENGVTRVRYADTVSALEPVTVFQQIQRIKRQLKLDIDFHGHNDFGLATANALSAFDAGAHYISCTINGLGERAGNTALEEVAAALKYLRGYDIKIDLKKITEISGFVEAASCKRLYDGKPIVGRKIFSHESGIHVHGLLKDEKTYELVSPEELGRKREFVLGKFSGTTSIMHMLGELGIKVDREKARAILAKIRKNINDSKNKTLNKIELKDYLYLLE